MTITSTKTHGQSDTHNIYNDENVDVYNDDLYYLWQLHYDITIAVLFHCPKLKKNFKLQKSHNAHNPLLTQAVLQ